jgi:antitoxin CptB
MSDFSKIQWRCRRGIKELDIVLSKYLEKYYKNEETTKNKDTLTIAFQELIALEDPVLYALLLSEIETDDKNQKRVLERLKNILIDPNT